MAKKSVKKSTPTKTTKVELKDVGKVIWGYLKGLHVAYYVGALAIVSILLFFSP